MAERETFWEAWKAATDEERKRLDPLDYEDPRYDEEMDWFDMEEEASDGR